MNKKNEKQQECLHINIEIPSQIIWYKVIMMLFAVYASFKHNKEFNTKHFFLAMLFPEIYIVYILALDKKSLLL